jgi:hypothetical protein
MSDKHEQSESESREKNTKDRKDQRLSKETGIYRESTPPSLVLWITLYVCRLLRHNLLMLLPNGLSLSRGAEPLRKNCSNTSRKLNSLTSGRATFSSVLLTLIGVRSQWTSRWSSWSKERERERERCSISSGIPHKIERKRRRWEKLGNEGDKVRRKKSNLEEWTQTEKSLESVIPKTVMYGSR